MEGLFQKLKNTKMAGLILPVALGALALILILWPPGGGTNSSAGDTAAAASFDADQYEARLSGQLEEILSAVEGAGKVRVMVMLDTGAEYIYAVETDEEAESRDVTDDGRTESERTRNVTEKYVILDQNGSDAPLVRMEIRPKIRGVAVICQGGDNILVKKQIIEAVTTVLGISTTKVCVITNRGG